MRELEKWLREKTGEMKKFRELNESVSELKEIRETRENKGIRRNGGN